MKAFEKPDENLPGAQPKATNASVPRGKSPGVKDRLAALEGRSNEEEEVREEEARAAATGKSPGIKERMEAMRKAQEVSKVRPERKESFETSVGGTLADRMADLAVAQEVAVMKARESAEYKGKGASCDIYDQAANLEAQGIGSALATMNAAGAGAMNGETQEIRRTVKSEENFVMHGMG